MFAGSLGELIRNDHVLVCVERVLDLGWLRAEVAECYAAGCGRPGIDPEAAVRLMLAGLLLGIVHDRRLMREAAVNIAIGWFAGYGLTEALPDHSSLTRIRQRWGAERFRWIFTRTVAACVAAGIAKGEVVHIDSSLVRADVSWEAIAQRHADAVEAANGPAEPVCRTDPDASLATNNRARRVEPAYKQHTAVDAEAGVVLDVAVTTGAQHDTKAVEGQLDAVRATTGVATRIATMDASEAKTWHGLAGAIRRGLANMQIQAFLTAAVINLKRLADTVLLALFAALAAANAPDDTGNHHPSQAR